LVVLGAIRRNSGSLEGFFVFNFSFFSLLNNGLNGLCLSQSNTTCLLN
jgi:hypothetical protein